MINAFFALWLSVYQDERADEFEPFQRADVVHDRTPSLRADVGRALRGAGDRGRPGALPVVDRGAARRDPADRVGAVRHRRRRGQGARDRRRWRADPFVLAGNPFADRFRRQGEDAALAWAVVAERVEPARARRHARRGRARARSRRYGDRGRRRAPAAPRALVRCRTPTRPAISRSCWFASSALPEAIALATRGAEPRRPPARRSARSRSTRRPSSTPRSRCSTRRRARETAARGSRRARRVDRASRAGATSRRCSRGCPTTSRSCRTSTTRASRSSARRRSQILRRVIALPEPRDVAGEARTALVMAWNNACIHAHALGDYRLAVELADGGQPFARRESVHLSLGGVRLRGGRPDRSRDRAGRAAIEHDYEHAEKMETDADLAPLQCDPRFARAVRRVARATRRSQLGLPRGLRAAPDASTRTRARAASPARPAGHSAPSRQARRPRGATRTPGPGANSVDASPCRAALRIRRCALTR